MGRRATWGLALTTSAASPSEAQCEDLLVQAVA